MKVLDSQSGYDRYASQYRKDHAHLDGFDWEPARALITARLHARLAASPGRDRLLDLGCGDGRVLKRLVRLVGQQSWEDRLELHGWDISDGMLKQAAKALGTAVRLERHDLMECRPRSQKGDFQLIVSFFVLVHIPDPRDFCLTLHRLLCPGGEAIFNTIPQKDALVLEAEGQKFQIAWTDHRPARVEAAIEEAGLVLEASQDTAWSRLYHCRKPL